MANLNFLKKKISEKNKQKKQNLGEPKDAKEEAVDMDRVEQIVKTMKKKYKEQGIEFEEVGGRLRELRGIIAEGRTGEIEIQKVEALPDMKNPIVKTVGNVYIKMRKIFEPITKLAIRLPQFDMLAFYLYSANMRYSARQYLALSVTGAGIILAFAFFIISIIIALLDIPLITKVLLIPLVSVFVFFFSLIVLLLIPSQKAKERGAAISIELPFALRHMATELRAGIGLYRTIQAIATAGYGALSEEFARTINEIEEGTDTKDALRHLALRTQSQALRNALMHIIRALKTGGNLSEIMNDIAEDVAFELRMSTRDFAAKMNFFGVIFIFAAIVMPVIIAILGGIRNSPIGESGGVSFKDMLPLGPEVIAGIYLILMPLMLLMFILYIKASQPKV